MMQNSNLKPQDMANDIHLSLLYRMLRVRRFEEKIAELYPEQEMRCPVHLSIGQEATAAGLSEALSDKDMVFSHHRSHGHYLAKKGDAKKFISELYGKSDGCCEGIGGSMHLTDVDSGFICSIPIVGGIIPIAVGAGLSNKMKNNGLISALYLGDATAEEGVVHESLNLASLKKLPVIFFCENNLFSVYTHIDERQPNRQVAPMVSGYGIPVEVVNGNDVYEVFEVCQRAVDHIRSGKGPYFIEANTYRWLEHCGPYDDDKLGYRSKGELNIWKNRCPIDSQKGFILAEGIATEEDFQKVEDQVAAEIKEAFEFAKNSPWPQKEDLYRSVYAD